MKKQFDHDKDCYKYLDGLKNASHNDAAGMRPEVDVSLALAQVVTGAVLTNGTLGAVTSLLSKVSYKYTQELAVLFEY
jgi:hypothetical protein